MTYRKLSYMNSKNEMIEFNVENVEVFLFEITGMGFSYLNEITDTNYQNVRKLVSTKNETNEITGRLEIIKKTNREIYATELEIASILNYDQLQIRRGQNVYGKLLYQNATGRQIFIPCLIKGFIFGETNDVEGYLHLPIEVTFERLTRVWYNYAPTIYHFEMEGGTAHGHPYNHPYSHMKPAGFGNVGVLSGNDLAKFNLEITGYFSNFTLTFTNMDTQEEQRIVYLGNISGDETLIVDNFNLSIRKNGVTDMRNIDLIEGNSPFFDLMPKARYSFKFDAAILEGRVRMYIYESWVSV